MTRANAPKRVLYCESNADGTIGGSHYCLLNLIERLDPSRFVPITHFYDDHALVPRFRAVGETIVAPPHDPWRLAAGSSGPLALVRRSVNFARFAAVVRERMRFLFQHRIALLHLNNSVTRHHDWMVAAHLTNTPCVTHERGLNPKYGWSDRFLGRHLDLIIPMSRWIQDHMTERGVDSANIRVLYDGLDVRRLITTRDAAAIRREWNVRDDQPVFGIVGNIREWKGQEVVIRALVEVVRQLPSAVCFVVGAATAEDRPYVDRLNTIISEAGIQNNVRFTGYQSQVPDFVNAMSVVVHASILPEPFGMVVLEGMAMRKPVVGSAAGGVIEMVVEGETGYTFPPGEPMPLAARLIELLSDPQRAAAMGEAGYQRVIRDFPLDRYADDIQDAYDRILAARNGMTTHPE